MSECEKCKKYAELVNLVWARGESAFDDKVVKMAEALLKEDDE